jgi:FkbM family methyltransferase
MKLRRILRQLGWKIGLEIRPYHGCDSEFPQTMRLLECHKINLVVDVGAHVGSWGERLYQMGYAGKMVSYEPLSWAHKILNELCAKYPGWAVAPRCALGSRKGTIDINISQNGESSSVLPMNDRHLEIAPDSKYVAKETVELITLDEGLKTYINNDTKLFVKIDAQGYEQDVLKGASSILRLAKGIQLELSTEQLYAGQELALSLMQTLSSLGFELHAVWPVVIDQTSGRTAQFDALFFRENRK